MNTDDVITVLARTKATWPHWTPGDPAATLAVWSHHLADIALVDATAAVDELAMTDQYAPGPGIVHRRALDIAGRRDGSGPPDHAAAFEQLLDAIHRHGWPDPDAGIAALHPAVASTVRALGGWQTVCEDTNPVALRAHFAKLYTASVERHTRGPAAAAIEAFAERLELPS